MYFKALVFFFFWNRGLCFTIIFLLWRLLMTVEIAKPSLAQNCTNNGSHFYYIGYGRITWDIIVIETFILWNNSHWRMMKWECWDFVLRLFMLLGVGVVDPNQLMLSNFRLQVWILDSYMLDFLWYFEVHSWCSGPDFIADHILAIYILVVAVVQGRYPIMSLCYLAILL